MPYQKTKGWRHTFNPIGARNFALSAGDQASAGNINILDNLSLWTLACWVRFRTLGVSRRIITKWSGGNLSFIVSEDDTNANQIILAHKAVSNAAVSISTNANLVVNKWYWLVWAGNQDVNLYKLFLNNAAITLSVAVNTTGPIVASTAPFAFGSDGTGNFTDSDICYVHAYNRALSSAEGAILMLNPGSIGQGLVGFWPFTDRNPSARDFSTNANHATYTGSRIITDSPLLAYGKQLIPKRRIISQISVVTPSTSKYRFRKTLSGIGTRTGSRQVHDWN